MGAESADDNEDLGWGMCRIQGQLRAALRSPGSVLLRDAWKREGRPKGEESLHRGGWESERVSPAPPAQTQ